MPLITIREDVKSDHKAMVSIDRGGEYSVTVSSPFLEAEENRLRWYFEEHLRFPFIDQTKVRDAGESVKTYGEKLFAQVFHG